MSMTPPRFAFRPEGADDRGFAGVAPSVGASQRASLGRGVAFVLLLAASSLTAVYVPQAMRGPHWVEGTAPGAPATDR